MDRSKWEYKKLGEVCAPKSDILRANKLFGNDDIIDYVDISSIDNTTHSITQPTSYVFKEAPSRAQQKVEQGDILYSLVRPNLKNIAVVTSSDTDKYVASSGFCVLRGKDVETRYLYHMVLGDAFTNYILGLVSGANYPAVREDDVKGFSFRCPPIADQQRIVAELDCLNEMIALKQEQLKEFDKLAQSIFYDMFGDLSINDKGWNMKPFAEIALAKTGITYKPDNVKDSGIIVLRSSNVQEDELAFEDVVRVDLPISEKYHVQNGDILMCSRNGSARLVGKTAKIMNVNEIMTWGAFMTIIRSKYNDYLLQYFKTDTFRNSLISSKTTTVHQITIGMLNALNIPLPPLALQQQFAEKIQAIEAQKELVKKSIAETQQLLDSRMDYYFD